MDPWDAHFHATAPVLNDPRIQDLNLVHSIMFLKGFVTREFSEPAFTDSRENFQVAQGWGGWFYSFETLPPIGSDESLDWQPSLADRTMAVAEGGTWLMDGSFASKPYIDDVFQEGWVNTRGERMAAIRTFRSPKPLELAVEANYRSYHTCGDGTRLSLVFVRGPGEAPEVLVEWSTMDDSFAEHVSAIAMRRGSTLSVVSDPLESSDCDRVEVHVKLTPVSLENQSWSALVRRMSGRQTEADPSRPDSAQSANATEWAIAEEKGPSDHEIFNLALIFDRNRFPHAKSVIRSIRHFTTSRRLVFHLIAPYQLHQELHEFFADTDMSLRVYDHSLCSFVARQVLPFSNPDIHISAHCKMFLSEIVTFAERILYLDTDVTVTSDLAACYDKPLANPGALVSMAVDMGDACQRHPDACWPIGLHWRLPEGLVCGNVPARAAMDRIPPTLCPEAGELETLQVNGGVALFELAKMKESGFLQRYVSSVVHHYRLMKSTPAGWGEQDFINSYFRLFPEDLEVLPCGCNYQWFGSRREVKCGLQPVTIAHHWCARSVDVLAHSETDDSATGRMASPLAPTTLTTSSFTTSSTTSQAPLFRLYPSCRPLCPARPTRQSSSSSTLSTARGKATTARSRTRRPNTVVPSPSSLACCLRRLRPTWSTRSKHRPTRRSRMPLRCGKMRSSSRPSPSRGSSSRSLLIPRRSTTCFATHAVIWPSLASLARLPRRIGSAARPTLTAFAHCLIPSPTR